MSQRYLFIGILVVTAALLWLMPAAAGGWAVITLDSWPEKVSAGQPVDIFMTVRQHGRTPLAGLEVTVKGHNPSSNQSFALIAQEQKIPGKYLASLTFPEAGKWEWSVQAFTMDQKMPDLEVMAGNPLTGETSTASTTAGEKPAFASFIPKRIALVLGLVSLAFGLGMAAAALWRKLQMAWVGAGIFGALAVLSLVFTNLPEAQAAEAGNPGTAEIASSTAPQTATPVPDAELGKILFITKGCITCHTHRAFADQGYVSLDIKNLSDYTAIPEYLRVWLKDPEAIKPGTDMPNLELKEGEIEALIAFLASQ